MKDLLPTESRTIGTQTLSTVNARDLHQFIQVGRAFPGWITNRIKEGSFIENEDYMVLSQTGRNLFGGRPKTEYHITEHMAEHLGMMERNERGLQVRNYYIQKRREASDQQHLIGALQQKLLLQNPRWESLVRYKRIGLNHREIARLLTCNVSTVRRSVRELERLGILQAPDNLHQMQLTFHRYLGAGVNTHAASSVTQSRNHNGKGRQQRDTLNNATTGVA